MGTSVTVATPGCPAKVTQKTPLKVIQIVRPQECLLFPSKSKQVTTSILCASSQRQRKGPTSPGVYLPGPSFFKQRLYNYNDYGACQSGELRKIASRFVRGAAGPPCPV